MAEQRHGRLHANECLAGVGEDGQVKDGAGSQMQVLQPVRSQDFQEEVRKWGDEPHLHEVVEDGDLSGRPGV